MGCAARVRRGLHRDRHRPRPSAVPGPRFLQAGAAADSADRWRLGRLFYYDANDMATLIATAMPFALYFLLGQRRPIVRGLAVVGLAILAVGMIRSGSRGGFIALLAVAIFVLLGFTTVSARARLMGLVAILAIVFAAASDRYWQQMQTIFNPQQDYNLTSNEGRIRVWKRGL